MTRLTRINVKCEECNIDFTSVVSASICTWMDPELTEEFLNHGISCKCPRCDKKIKIKGKILINARNGADWLDNDLDYETKLKKLIEWGAVDKKGKAFPMFGLNPTH